MQHTDTAPSPVPAVAKPEGDTPAPHRWAWVEASIWTERMLAALDNGVQGGRWYSLMDKVASAHLSGGLETGRGQQRGGRSGWDQHHALSGPRTILPGRR